MNIHIIQCDCVIQEHVKITCRDAVSYTHLDVYKRQGNNLVNISPLPELSDSYEETSAMQMCIRDRIGQETCGPGGFAYGMRSVPAMIELVKTIRRLSLIHI